MPPRPPHLLRLLPLSLAGCDGPQSALSPAGADAQVIATLFWWMAGGALVVWLGVIGLSVYVMRLKRGPFDERTARWLIIGGGTLFPTVVLTGLLLYALPLLDRLTTPPPPGDLVIAITGEQWWWRVRYLLPDRPPIELANELHLPVGRRTALRLDSPDVIHAFWVPSLGGKVDMIPGRVNRAALEPTRTGVFRGACAEFCGRSHAWMSLYAVVHEPDDFEAWLEAQATPARPPEDALAARGQEVFLATGCGACHTVRGTPADGRIGPDLTHVGGRLSLGAGVLGNDAEAFRRWLAHTDTLKPGVKMPAFDVLPADELRALAAWLEGLR